MESILTSVKKNIGGSAEDTYFEPDIKMHINSTLMTLTQLGVGPPDGFMINGVEETWEDFIGDRKDLAAIQSYVYLKVRLLFDPPTTSFVLSAMKDQASEYEWRLNVQVEGGTTIA